MLHCMQVVGYKNRGKTTLIEYLVAYFCERNQKVACLKHHGHGGVPLGWEATDNARHLKAGASFAGVEGESMLQITTNQEWNLETLMKIYALLDIEILFVEGFKKANQEKIVMITQEEDLVLLEQVSNIKAVVTTLELNENMSIPAFYPKQWKLLAQWLEKQWCLSPDQKETSTKDDKKRNNS
ncbi:Molybdopterin-guanine dinucleotide biosynthesis adapter protein [Paraliobacillus sp. PM-2]|uniref:molybdopterin-guanine dinucleotide biosynthesis protein B n=1 Tax=Paraliobacillus sp. PM-2 TaxID=1462524 RepID=UPI00061CB9F0|nr:molybdopterin-guanine dinucleotide biosynthesis protein B [Paraliobacillus sp. PM-2]CQR46568.1 Molybdopterin-guanine dinucleotide biosynthesis adapter protein [Paraliobacillus sp. PM-2]